MAQVSYGTITITDTTDKNIFIRYSANADGSSSTSSPTSNTKYVGIYCGIAQTEIEAMASTTDWTWSEYIGTDGVSVTGITEIYQLRNDSATPAKRNDGTALPTAVDTVNTWSLKVPPYESGGIYWTSTAVSMSETPSPRYTTPVKNEALTDMNYNAYIANSIASHANEDAQGAMGQAASNLNSIVRLWQAKSVHSAPEAPSTEIITGSISTYNNWSTVKPTATDTYRYFYYCDQSKTGGGVCTWSEVVEDTSYLSTYEINALNVRTKNFFKGLDNSYDGWFASGRTSDEGLDTSNAETYFYNARVAATHIALGYNKTPIIDLDGGSGTINIYRFPIINNSTKKVTTAGSLGMQLSATDLIFYKPPVGNNSPVAAATLNANGLNISDGSIELANGTNNSIKISNSDFTRDINNISRSNLRMAIGSKFGVKNDGTLYASNANIEGAITATSLTIGSGATAYNGASAINASGYTIEIIEDKTAAPTGSVITEGQTYLYPIIYQNGVAITTGITKTNFIWYTNNNTATTGGAAGDSANGGIIATYGNTYRVTYSFNDDAVGTAQSQQTINVNDTKHITDINSTGITIHPETANGNYMQLDTDGLKIYRSNTLLASYGTTVTIGSIGSKNVFIDSNGVQIRNGQTVLANFGTTAQIGQNNSSRFLINNDSLQAYNSSNVKYFEVNASGLSWGSNTAATTTQVEAAAQTASNYITEITANNGIRIHSANTENNSIVINSTGVEIFQGGTTDSCSIAKYSDIIRVGKENNSYIILNNNGMEIFKSNNSVAFYGDITRIGKQSGESKIELDYHSLKLIGKEGNNNTYLYVSDLRDRSGEAEISITFVSDGIAQMHYLIPEAKDTNYTVTVNNVEVTNFLQKTTSFFALASEPSEGALIIVTYTTTEPEARAFTFGSRDNSKGTLGMTSAVFGNECVASGAYAFALGSSNIARGKNSLVGGLRAVANGDESFSFGIETVTNAYCSAAMGLYNTTNPNAVCSFVFGEDLTTNYPFQTIIGNYNNNKAENLFEVGNGLWKGRVNSNALELNYNGKLTIASTLTQNSDRRLKTHINYLSNDAIDFIQKLKPVYYIKDEEKHLGFYAQDVEEIDSWNCMIGEMNGYKTLGYTELIAPLVTYCQHLEKRILKLENQFKGGSN